MLRVFNCAQDTLCCAGSVTWLFYTSTCRRNVPPALTPSTGMRQLTDCLRTFTAAKNPQADEADGGDVACLRCVSLGWVTLAMLVGFKKNCMGVWKMSTHYTCGCPSAICNGFKTPRCDYQYTMLKGGKLNLENWEAA